jgi:shikimate dehydrogenase
MKCYGLIGKTLKHSFSKDYFKKKFEQEKISGYRYDNYELKSIEELPGLIRSKPQLHGLNVTIPYKEVVLEFLDTKDPLVEQAGACNCISISPAAQAETLS